jgi:hypothetical protein
MLGVFFNSLIPKAVRTVGEAISDASEPWKWGHVHLRDYRDLGPRQYILTETQLRLREPYDGKKLWPQEVVYRIDDIDPPTGDENTHEDKAGSEDGEAESDLPSQEEIVQFSLGMASTAMADLHNVLADGYTNRSCNAINALGTAAAYQECSLPRADIARVRAILAMTTSCAAQARRRDRW